MSLEEEIRRRALSLGFDVCRMTTATLPDTARTRLKNAVDHGWHGSMAWMETRQDERSHPQSLWPDAKSVIMLGMNYGPNTDPLLQLEAKSNGAISVYAQNEDYHDLIKKRLKQIGRWMVETFDCDIKVFVDTAPVMEKPLAAQSGMGWQGKHTNLVNREFGSWLFLGSVFTTLSLAADDEEIDHCGSCQACLDICPTKAFPAPYQLDGSRCISYLTIEHKGSIPAEFRAAMGNRIYGCDDCLAICPWNKFAQEASELKLVARDELKSPTLSELVQLDDTSFRALFRKSPVKRIGRDRFIRNVLIAIGNSGNRALLPHVEERLFDDASEVRAMAVWAWRRLGGKDEKLSQLRSIEQNRDVLSELNNLS